MDTEKSDEPALWTSRQFLPDAAIISADSDAGRQSLIRGYCRPVFLFEGAAAHDQDRGWFLFQRKSGARTLFPNCVFSSYLVKASRLTHIAGRTQPLPVLAGRLSRNPSMLTKAASALTDPGNRSHHHPEAPCFFAYSVASIRD